MVLALGFAAWLAAGAQAAVPQAPPVTLQSLIAQARQSSPLRAGAAARASGARQAATLAGRPLNPLLDLRSENWTPSSASRLPLDVWALATQPIELGGKRAARRRVAAATSQLAAASLDVVDRQIVEQTVAAYLDALQARGALATLAANREGLSTLIDAMRRRVDEGSTAEADLLRFMAEDARLGIDVARASRELDRALTELTAIVGASARIDASSLIEPRADVPLAADETTIAAAVARRPEVLEAGARVVRAERGLQAERAMRLPDPAITAGFKRTVGVGTFVAAVTTTIPLFDRNSAAIAEATGEARAAAADRDALARRLAGEAAVSVRSAQALADRARGAERELEEPARGVRDAARAAFREGAVDVLRLIDAERVYAEVQRVALDLRLEAVAAAIRARMALGEEPLP